MGALDSTLSRLNKSDFENGYTVHSKLYRFNKQIMRMATQYTVHYIGLIKQIMRMGTVHSTLYRFEKSDYENGHSTQYTV